MNIKREHTGISGWLYYIFVEVNVPFMLLLVAIPVFLVLGVGNIIYELVSDGWEQQELVEKQGTLNDVRFSLNVPVGLRYGADASSAGWQEDIAEYLPVFYIEITEAVLPSSDKDAVSRFVSRHDTRLVVVEASCEMGGCLVTTKRDDDRKIDVYVFKTRSAGAKKNNEPQDQPTLRCQAHLENASGVSLGNIDGAIAYLKQICGSLEII
jgi:hypothetical protein